MKRNEAIQYFYEQAMDAVRISELYFWKKEFEAHEDYFVVAERLENCARYLLGLPRTYQEEDR